MVVHSAGVEGQDLSISGSQRQQLAEQAKALQLDTILAGLDILVTAKTRMRLTSYGRVLLEIALVRLSQLEDLVPLTQMARWLQQEGTAPAAARAPRAIPAVQSDEKKKVVLAPGSTSPEIALPLADPNLDAIWAKVLTEVGFAIAGLLKKAASVAIAGPNCLAMRVSQRYNTPGGALLDSSRLARVEEVLHKITGQPCTMQVEFIKDDDPAAESVRSSVAPPSAQSRQQRAEVMQLPLVKKAVDVLGAQLIKADEGFGAALEAPAQVSDQSVGEEE
jgi:DNA polymerase III subunit gamma/tau